MFNNGGLQGFSAMPVVVKNLLIINGLMLLARFSILNAYQVDLNQYLGLHLPGSSAFSPYQIITYMFMHGDFRHLFFNMFAIWMFGSVLESTWGPKRFITYYLLTGIGAAALHYGIVYAEIAPLLNQASIAIEGNTLEHFHKFMTTPEIIEKTGEYYDLRLLYNEFAANPNLQRGQLFAISFSEIVKNSHVVVGASGSLFGLLLAYGMLFPNSELFLMFIPVPIKAKYFVAGYGLIELFAGLQNNPSDNVAHFAHLGGMLFGYILIRYWKSKQNNNNYYG